MRKAFFTLTALALLSAAGAQAASGKRATTASPLPAAGNQSLPLSAGECRRLGGIEISGRSECATGLKCSVVKPNGEVFSACITEAK